jgi:hypothetical protein
MPLSVRRAVTGYATMSAVTASTWKRICNTALVILVPILLVPFIMGIFHVRDVSEPLNSLIYPVIWIVGVAWIWRPARLRNS